MQHCSRVSVSNAMTFRKEEVNSSVGLFYIFHCA